MKLIHYGTSSIDLSSIEEIENKLFSNKPNGGLWCSPMDCENSWKEFCLA